MTIHCFQVLNGPKIVPCEYNFALDAISQKTGGIWIDIQDAEPQELEEKLDDINVHGPIRTFSLGSRDHPGFYPMHPLALMVIPVQMEEQDVNVLDYLALISVRIF